MTAGERMEAYLAGADEDPAFVRAEVARMEAWIAMAMDGLARLAQGAEHRTDALEDRHSDSQWGLGYIAGGTARDRAWGQAIAHFGNALRTKAAKT